MKKINLLILLLPAVFACSPVIYPLSIEERQPSKSGLDLARKSMAVVYDDAARDTAFSYAFAESFATALEKDYFNGERTIGIYSVDLGKGDYESRDSMVSLVMQTDADVVFVLKNPETGALVRTADKTMAPVSIKMLAYDSMGGEKDKVRSFNGTVNLSESGSLDEEAFRSVLTANAKSLGNKASSSFLSTWKEENYGVYYFDSAVPGWYEGTAAAANFEWKKAIEYWFKTLDTKNMERRACAEFNIALACYMMEDYPLALKWLDRADADCQLSLSAALRKKLQNKIR